ncbi:zinc finger CCCH domain-containing protein 6 isoform X2 [Trichomycterus rosablanca]|uniref:zinc finger CCCH domain-containing protein 6 isoform X2 n=1 Tax=Trichomycterus rosablanca TaxID=2290929 RepID=UPI002F354D70
MAFVSLFSCTPNPVFDINMPRSGAKREDGELEDEEIDNEGVEIEEKKFEVKSETSNKCREKEEVQENNDTLLHSQKRHRKIKEKQRSKRRRRDRVKHHLPSSGSSSDSHDSDHDHQDRLKNKKGKGFYRDYDGRFALHEQEQLPSLTQCKNSESKEKYDYEAEQADFSEELSRYKLAKELTTSSQGKSWNPKIQAKKSSVKGQQFCSLQGRGHGGGCGGRGRGVQTKNKKKKCKNLGRERGRAEEIKEGQNRTKVEAQSQPNIQKKRPFMSQQFICQHTFEHNGRNICKYFIEGRCIKGDLCKFEHGNVVPEKKKELCKFYVQGCCTKGESCMYMHNEYPCKFFHTGTKCYQGGYCKFSHDPLTNVTKELLDKVLKTDGEHTNDFKRDLEDPKKQGIFTLPNPSGVGLPLTCESESPQDGSKKIPSLFGIKVQSTVGLAQKIALKPNFYNCTSPPLEQFQGSRSSAQFSNAPGDTQAVKMMSPSHSHSLVAPPGSPGSMTSCSSLYLPGIFQSPKRQAKPLGFGLSTPVSPTPLSNQPTIHQNNSPQRNQQETQVQPVSGMQMPSELFKNLFTIHSLGLSEEGQSGSMQDSQQNQGNSTEFCSGMQRFLPAVQKALLLHFNQSQQDSEFHGPHKKHPISPTKKEKVHTTNWNSSDEDGSSVLKTLKKQDKMLKAQHSQAHVQHFVMDPRLYKKRALPANSCVMTNFGQHILDTGKDDKTIIDPRQTKDPYMTKPVSLSKVDSHHSLPQKPSATEEDEEEWKLRDQTALIPLDSRPGASLQDPRCQIKQFSHIRVDFFLQRPAFAHSVVWAPEDLIPLMIPKKELSINLPLSPLIADAQLNHRQSSLSDRTFLSARNTLNTSLSATHLSEDVDGLGITTGMTREHPDKPTNPLTHKVLDPRINRSGSLDSKRPANREGCSSLGIADPLLQRSAAHQTTTLAKLDTDKPPPYVPHLASSASNIELRSPTTLLGAVSLYDPRIHTLLSPNQETKKLWKKEEMLKQSVKCKSLLFPQVLSTPQEASEQVANDSNKKIQTNDSQLYVAAPVMHNLPVKPLAGLIRPAFTDAPQNRPSNQAARVQEEEDEKKDVKEKEKRNILLRDVFKTFDPTASPFCH